jgi:hypothetical protein
MRARFSLWLTLLLLLALATCAPVTREAMPRETPRPDALAPSLAPAVAPTPQADAADIFTASVMYWATPRPILCKDWYVVVAGAVTETHPETIPGLAKERYTMGTLKVERVLLSLPTEREAAPARFAYFKSDGFEGLRRGDKVLVFVNEYDGGYGIIEAAGSNCKLGIRVRGWDDPVVKAVEALTSDAHTAQRPDGRAEVLKNPKYARAFRPFSGRGAGGKGCWE